MREENLFLDIIEDKPTSDNGQPIRLITRRGDVACRFYTDTKNRYGAIWVGGAGGGWDTPANGLYPRLCSDLTGAGVASLRVRFRNPVILKETVFDILAGISFLENKGIDTIALTGHSMGGASVIQAAAQNPAVRTVVTLATQSYGVDPVTKLGPHCSILLLHGMNDKVLPADCSKYTYQIARQPKQLVFYPNAGHVLDEVADEVFHTVRKWIITELNSL